MHSNIFHWHLINSIPALGSHSLYRLMQYSDDAQVIIHLGSDKWQQLGLKPAACRGLAELASQRDNSNVYKTAVNTWQIMEEQAITPITLHCKEYPERLALISDPPAMLYVKGKLPVLHEPQIAIVGSRNASPDGLALAASFAKELALSGITVTSGLALGVDGLAHDGAIAGGGDTCAVLGCGVDIVYPVSHRSLSKKVIESGVLISEYLPSTQPRPGHFPKRNRIIAGLSLGVLVVEAAVKSGSLITARLAMDYNREVFAIPGSIHNPRARGCHQLIRQGAVLVETVGDILTEVKPLLGDFLRASDAPVDAAKLQLPHYLQTVAAAMGYNPISVDLLSQRLAMPVHELSSCLLELELLDHIIAVPGGYQLSH